MKRLVLILISVLLGTCVYAASPTISVKKKSKILLGAFGWDFNKAVNTTTGETLVTFGESGTFGVLISPKGKLIGKKFPIPAGGGFGTDCVYNPVRQEYFYVYAPFDRSLVPYGSIYGVRLDQHGKLIGKEITVVPGVGPEKPNDLGDNSFPYLIFNPKTNGYIMIWERTEGIAAALLDENGKLTSPIKIIKTNPGSNGYYDWNRYGRIQDVQWLASGKKLLVVFRQHFADWESDDWLAALDPLLKSPPKVSKIYTFAATYPDGGGNGTATLGILPDDTACVFYEDFEVVRGRSINKKGKLTSEPFLALSAPDTNLHAQKVAFSTNSAGTFGLLMALEEVPDGAPLNTWAQALDDHCRPAGEAKIVATINVFSTEGVLFALPQKPSDDFSQFIWMQSIDAINDDPYYILKLQLQVTP